MARPADGFPAVARLVGRATSASALRRDGKGSCLGSQRAMLADQRTRSCGDGAVAVDLLLHHHHHLLPLLRHLVDPAKLTAGRSARRGCRGASASAAAGAESVLLLPTSLPSVPLARVSVAGSANGGKGELGTKRATSMRDDCSGPLRLAPPQRCCSTNCLGASLPHFPGSSPRPKGEDSARLLRISRYGIVLLLLVCAR